MLRSKFRLFLTLPVGITAMVTVSGSVSADWRADLGWTDFKDALGPGYPDGSSVLVVQAEAYQTGNYLPDALNPEMAGKTITPHSSGGNSSHALTVAKHFYGNTTGMAHGVTDIHAYYAGDYLTIPVFSSISSTRRVHCNAWYGTSPDPAGDLGDLDSVIASKGFLVVGGLNNGSGTSVPHIFASTYNALSVGLTTGGHSRGGTIVAGYGVGRVKPEIVLPDTATSWATGGACSLAAVLYEVAATGGHTDAETNSEVMKAIIMAGATKQEFDDWDRTTTRPLDEVYGAGEVNILNSHQILAAGQHPPGVVPPTGWSYNNIYDPPGPGDDTSRSYEFAIPANSWGDDFSVILNWNHDGSGIPRDLRLELYSLTGGTILLDESDSVVDNVEHIYRRNLPAGSYRLTVSRSDAVTDAIDYGLAWQAQLGNGPHTFTGESANTLPEITVTNIFKDRPYIIERSLDLDTWTEVHSFTPTTWADFVWEDPAGFSIGDRAFYRSGFTP